MFQHLTLYKKLLLITAAYILLGFFIVYFYIVSISVTRNWAKVLLAFAQCWNFLGIAFIFFQTFKYVRLNAFYYQLRPFETPRYFKSLGVIIFQTILINSFFRYLNPRVYLKGRKRDYIKIYHDETRLSETSHLLSFCLKK